MTLEEMEAKIAEIETKNSTYESNSARFAELEARFSPVVDSDLAYKPKTWKDLDDSVNSRAESIALKVLEDSKKKEKEEVARQEEDVKKYEKQIEDSFKKLEEDGIIEPTTTEGDNGFMQRQQILGGVTKVGGQHVEIEARRLKTLWDQGLMYDYKTNGYLRSNAAPSATRDMVVGSSASRVPVAPTKGMISSVGARGDLDEMQKRWEDANGKA